MRLRIDDDYVARSPVRDCRRNIEPDQAGRIVGGSSAPGAHPSVREKWIASLRTRARLMRMSGNSALAAWFVPVRYGPARLLVPLTIFLGALLLFAVEPLIAKMILPWFGGSAEVWIACLLFFQAALLAGYLYAHLLNTRISESWQWRAHLFLLALSLVFLPIIPAERWKPIGDEAPLPFILALLAATI